MELLHNQTSVDPVMPGDVQIKTNRQFIGFDACDMQATEREISYYNLMIVACELWRPRNKSWTAEGCILTQTWMLYAKQYYVYPT